ncbi:unnamed protein product, partial [marine sediment metagenome]
RPELTGGVSCEWIWFHIEVGTMSKRRSSLS